MSKTKTKAQLEQELLKAQKKLHTLENARAPKRRPKPEDKNASLMERMDIAVRAALIGIWDWDIKKNEITWDDQMYRLYGLEPGAFGGAYEAWLNGVHPDDRASSDEESQQAIRGEKEYDTEFRVLWPDGSTHWLKATGQVFRDGKGKPLRMVGVNYDITARKQTETDLRESEEKLNKVLNLLPVGVSILDQDRKVAYSNETLGKILGITKEALLRGEYHARKYLRADGSAKSVEELASVHAFKEQVELHDIITGVVKEDGQIIWTSVSAVPVDFPDWKVILVTADVTERHESDMMRAQLASIIDSSEDAVIGKTLEGVITSWNPGAERLYGYLADEVIGQSISLLMPSEYKDDLPNILARLKRGESIKHFETQRQRKDGTRLFVSLTISPIKNSFGQIIGASTIARDITEHKQAEKALSRSQENFSKAFNSNPAAIAITRLTDGEFININPAYTQIMEYEPREILGHKAAELNIYVHPGERAQIIQQLREQGSVQNYELLVRIKSGETRSIVISMVPIRYNEEECILTVFIDISERKKMEAELQRSNAELEQFAYVASHDLQEPLRAVAGMVQLLGQRYQGQLDERADEYIGHAVEASQRMQKLINDLLDYSRVDRYGKPFEQTRLETALKAALANLQFAIEESGAEVTYDPLPTIMADPSQMTQVLQNLIGNAIKFRGKDTPRIHVAAKKIDNHWQVEVCDNGIGIEPQYFERIFLIFQRLHTRKEYPGTGIGLSLCKKIIERHKGRIWIESKPEQGSTFYFTIPEKTYEYR